MTQFKLSIRMGRMFDLLKYGVVVGARLADLGIFFILLTYCDFDPLRVKNKRVKIFCSLGKMPC